MPGLTSVTLSYDEEWDGDQFESFIIRSECILEELALFKSPLSSIDLIQCLRLNPSLKRVHRGMFEPQPPLGKSVIRAMASWDYEKKEFSLCPKLEVFSMDANALRTGIEPLFASMINRRLLPPEGRATFKKLQILGDNEKILDRLGDLCDDSIELTTQSIGPPFRWDAHDYR
ncbi:hypothetical protein GALMADRAFT_147032 [Galerina marginata CBS 339.88]|uniref:Uncharacterized protein n=1 Tax=Galerina marginata (strain CBS 339.88) TaxID=685588 RepID=A0A067SC08_GALM3|nr:hypothetical protein GALMADRAFT_147032 [Galerina marginata CBS 339.88]